MVELFTAGCFGRSPGVVNARSPASLRTSSPRRLGLNEVQDPDPPETDYASIEPKLSDRLTVSSMTARASDPVRDSRTRVCPGRPGSVAGGASHRIEAADCSRGLTVERLLAAASVEPDKHVSTHPALRVSDCHMPISGIVGGVMSPAPFARLVRPGSRGSESVCGRRGGWWADSGVPRDTVLETASRTEQYPILRPKQPPPGPARVSHWDIPLGSQSMVTCGHFDDIVTTDDDSWMTLAT